MHFQRSSLILEMSKPSGHSPAAKFARCARQGARDYGASRRAVRVMAAELEKWPKNDAMESLLAPMRLSYGTAMQELGRMKRSRSWLDQAAATFRSIVTTCASSHCVNLILQGALSGVGEVLSIAVELDHSVDDQEAAVTAFKAAAI